MMAKGLRKSMCLLLIVSFGYRMIKPGPKIKGRRLFLESLDPADSRQVSPRIFLKHESRLPSVRLHSNT
jgi:hypothetical protein